MNNASAAMPQARKRDGRLSALHKVDAMRIAAVVIIAFLTFGTVARAQTVQLKPELAGLLFLAGRWGSGSGIVAETGGSSRGTSIITSDANGGVLLRRDHTDLFDASGKATGAFDQVMMIYAEGGAIHADYADGDHVIHYTSATVVPGSSVIFATAISAGAPAYRLSYTKTDADTLAIRFEIEPPGQSAFRPIATGTLKRAL